MNPEFLKAVKDGQGYKASSRDEPIGIVNLHDLEKQAEKSMLPGPFGYYRSGCEDEYTLRRNIQCFETKHSELRVLRKVESVDTSTKFFGIPLSMPIIQCPNASQRLAHVEGEVATARACSNLNTIFTLSALGTATIEESAAAAPGAPQFFQLYLSKNDDFNKFTLGIAKKVGIKAIVLTADAIVGGYREDDIRNNFVFPFPLANYAAYAAQSEVGSDAGSTISEVFAAAKQALEPSDIAKIKEWSGGLPVLVKGVQTPEDAAVAIGAGADGIWVSNHGGRQMDGAPGSFECLEAIAKVVNKEVPIVFDSGIRRGSHVYKALAAGADVVAIGRPVLYGLHLGGSKGVESVYKHLQKELIINMYMGGTQTIEDVKNVKLS